ncbi:hypothetical protein E2P81_ATG04093 [Venturia nashicola]|uniref:Dolichol-phosphate mannosyltransferase subunit 3 n=1 Tax=Venturia nashicola TaxID=86259 RepID=A0A4Z1P9Y7_9PEZI|nr:hypothetical protein E6O75_ATG04193 [Venturia nashicola]TLD37281.1 hypothetical protein E2P81_ATG04093 [Venturia nashicola]
MPRAVQQITILVVLGSMYLALLFGYAPLPAKVQDEVVPVLPFWALVTFGAYLLFKLGYGVFTFNDVPEAYKELMGEIETARADLKSKGVSVD